jgi:S-DNA-T family DNA segregation ATPase FtsK/SpoIIIE
MNTHDPHPANGAMNTDVNDSGPSGRGRVIEFPGREAAGDDGRPRGWREPTPTVVDGDTVDGRGPLVDPPPAASPAVQPWRREVERRPVVAPWLRSGEDVRAAARWAAGWLWHATGFHVLRAPLYAARLTAQAPRGVGVALVAVGRWMNDAETRPLRENAVRMGEGDQWLRIAAAREQRVRVRRRLALAGALAAAGGAVALYAFAPPWAVAAVVAVGVLVLGKVGTPADRPVTGRSVVTHTAVRLTSDMVIRALGALGLAEINKALTKGPGVTFPAPITRDGPGWRADVDLPFGVTVGDIMERRDRLASGLRRPLGCVWPEPAHDAHAGRLVLWVGDQDMSQTRPGVWPLAKHGRTDLFQPVPFGRDQRGRTVAVLLMFANVLIGAMPRFGKTFALRVLVLAAALDPGAQLRVFELKGTGDLSAVEPVAHHYGAGADEQTLAACMDSLRDLHRELDSRAATIRGLPRELCPENKVTPELAARRRLGLFTIVASIDECQELFSHPDYRDEADRLATAIIKRGPALGIILILATQRPDAKSLPTGVSANVGIRYCLRVMGQVENDMVLGTSAYKNGLRATTFGPRDKGIGYLVGASDDPQIVRTDYIDSPTAEAIITRARVAREAAGTITGHAAGEHPDQDGPARSVLADVAAVFAPGEDRLWSDVIAARLAEQWPTVYRGATPAGLAAALKPYGLAPAQVWATDPETGEGRNRRGYHREAISAALAESAACGSAAGVGAAAARTRGNRSGRPRPRAQDNRPRGAPHDEGDPNHADAAPQNRERVRPDEHTA